MASSRSLPPASSQFPSFIDPSCTDSRGSSNLGDPSQVLNLFKKLCKRQSNLLVTLTNTSSIRTHLRHDGELTKVNGGESFLTTVPGLLKLLDSGKAEEEEVSG